MASTKKPLSKSGSHLVAAGILLSRVMGLVRQKVFAHYFGNSDAGDAFYAALKIPNFLQNLLGDGVLSASFIPVYAGMRARKSSDEADRVAGIVGSLLFLVNAVLVLIGVLATPDLIDLIAPGFHGEKRALTIRLVQIFFPGTGMLAMSAWCLGVLNSHRKFFLSYAAPVIWNLSIIVVLMFFGDKGGQNQLAIYASWAVTAGALLQFGIQFPEVRRSAPALRWELNTSLAPVREIFRNLVPVVIARGVVQISAYVDNVLASLLPGGAVSALAYAQSLYMLPISLFGMSVSAAELPAMSGITGSDEEIATQLRTRVTAGMRQISFFVVPSVVGFLCLGDVIVAGLLQGGEFGHKDTLYVWAVLAGSTVGLLATTLGRLFSSTFYSYKDTRTPLRFAMLRVFLTSVLGWALGLWAIPASGLDRSWGAVGLTASAGFAGWIEFLLLRQSLKKKIGDFGLPSSYLLTLWAAAIASGAVGWSVKMLFGHAHPVLGIFVILIPYGVTYFLITAALKLEESRRIWRIILRRF